MANQIFYREQEEQSLVKSTIVSKYFWAWAKIMISQIKRRKNPRIGYIDLFAGRGRYEDGSPGTPLLLMESAIADEEIREYLITLFNDKDRDEISLLREEIKNIPDIDLLKFEPKFRNFNVSNDLCGIVDEIKLIPSLVFIDPWGYKGVSLRLINSFLNHWGTECILFFNYNRISMGLTNELVKDHMIALFGEDYANTLCSKLVGKKSFEKESVILEALATKLQGPQEKFVLPFRFVDKNSNRTSHHLIFITTNFRGYEIMKEVMAGQSSSSDQGVPSFEYRASYKNQGILFDLSRPIDELEQMLLEMYAEKTITFKKLYEEHNVGYPYIKKNYREVLLKMEEDRIVIMDPPNRRRGTLAEHVKITFPGK